MMTLTAVVVVQGYIGVSKVGEAHDAAESLYQQRLKPAVALADLAAPRARRVPRRCWRCCTHRRIQPASFMTIR
jgi:hypothetical protein